MEKTIFYFRHNSTLLRYSPWLIIVLSVFWSIYNTATADSMHFFETGAIFAILAMSVMAGIDYCFVFSTKHLLETSEDETEIKKALDSCELVTFLEFIVLAFASAMILGANNYSICLTGQRGTMQSIALSSTLLFIPAITPFPKKEYGIFLFAAAILSLGIPLLMPGKECYSILPELILRGAMAIAYLVVWDTIEKNYMLEQRIKSGNTKILSMLTNMIELRDLESGEHVSKVQNYTEILLRTLAELHPEYGLTSTMERNIVDASSMHDIGKLMVPDNILLKPGRLTADEFEIMKQHTVKGKEILESLPDEILEKNFLRYSIDICESHHEKYDGNGYPKGLAGDDIPLWSQVVSIVDCYEALTSKRHYKDAFSHEKSVEMICSGECGSFSPAIMESFIACSDELKACLES